MKTAKEVECEFKNKLALLLAEYSRPGWKADLRIDERSCMGGWGSYGVMVVDIPPEYDRNGDVLQEGAEFDLPSTFDMNDGRNV